MSHITGTVQLVSPAITVGPDSGSAPTAPNTWTHNFAHTPAAGGTKFIILHFRNVSLPANNRLEVDLGYDTDVFRGADGAEFYTRPINIHVLAGGLAPIRYITDGATTGGVQLDQYGRGEQHDGEPGHPSVSNSDPFLPGPSYVEPTYDPFWFCHTPPHWENIQCVSAPDGRSEVARSVGMIVSIHGDHVSTCSVTLIGPDLVITAGHCLPNPALEVPTSSVTFDYQVNCDGAKPMGYNARFFKVKKNVKFRNQTVSGSYHDYCLLQLQAPPGGIGVPHVPMRPDLPGVGEAIYGIHHPNGAVKKLSIPHPGFATVNSSAAGSVRCNLDVSGGSSGSGLFDGLRRIVGVLSNGSACSLSYFPTATILQDIAAVTTEPPVTRDVMVVLDRSGSMGMNAGTGRSKIVEARDAASLFVQLVRAGTSNRIGLVSFSTAATAPVDFAIAAATAANKTTLIGPAPYAGGIVGGLTPGGATSIGAGLETARMQFPVPGANPRSILLLTDGLQNTPPMIAAVGPALAGIDVNAIGFGTEASLDGALLTQLAQAHNGLYTRAGSGLQLKKFFALAFGNIFEAGALMDPEVVLPKEQNAAAPIAFHVCGEETLTIVLGWDREEAPLLVQARTPGGVVVHGGSSGTDTSTGRTWMFLRVPLPFGGERDGVWKVEVFRPGGGEFPPPAVEVRFFVNVIAAGGPRMERMPLGKNRYYTGDAINPLVALKYHDGTFPPDAKVQVTVTKPKGSLGNILSAAKLRAPAALDADTIPARQATLQALETESGRPVVDYIESTHDLFDDAAHEDGTFEEDGIFGNPLKDILTVEGNYTFHFKASYGEGCTANRELLWSLHVDAAVDPGRTGLSSTLGALRPDGRREVTITLVPRDPYGNHVGPGRLDVLTVSGAPGTEVIPPLMDNGDGSYSVPGIWDPSAGQPPGVVIGQPDRPPVVVFEPHTDGRKDCSKWKTLCWIFFFLMLVLLFLWLFK
jgi:V8-like Glu-specific endopeptidase